MGFPLSQTPKTVKTRIWKHGGFHYVIERDGEGWESVARFRLKKKALAFLEDALDKKLYEWSQGIKIRAGWACGHCGEMEKVLLDAHHIKPRQQFPGLIYETANGECLCLWMHAYMHRDNLVAQNLVLLRLCRILTAKLYRPLSKCQRMLFGEGETK